MKYKPLKKSPDEDDPKSKKVRSSRDKRRRRRRSRSRSRSFSGSDSPVRKRSKISKKVTDKKSKKNKRGSSHRRRRSPSPSPSRSLSSGPPSVSRSYSSSSRVSEKSVSPLPKGRSRYTKKGKGRGRDRERGRKRRRTRRSRSYSSHNESSGSSRSRSRSRSKSKSKSRRWVAGGARNEANRDKIVPAYDDCGDYQNDKNSIEDVDRDEAAVADVKKERSNIDEDQKNVGLEKIESPPAKDANENGEIVHAGKGSPVAEDLELILRQKALANFRKFRGAVVTASKTQNNGRGEEVVPDRLHKTDTGIAEASSATIPFHCQGRSLGESHSSGSPRLEDPGNGRSPSWKQGSSPGMSHGAVSPIILETGDTTSPSSLGASHATAQPRLQDIRITGSVMQRLGSIPRNSISVKQRLGSSPAVSHVNGTPGVRSVVSIPTREELDASTVISPLRARENSVPVENCSEVRQVPVENCSEVRQVPVENCSEVRQPPIETNQDEGTNEDNEKTSEASASGASVLPSAEDKNQAELEVKDGSQFEQKTFSRMQDGEMVQVSYKVYIPKKSPALARRKLQR